MDVFNRLKQAVEEAELDAAKFYDKTNKAAGVRLRKAMQEIKKLAQDVRADVSDKVKAE
jgi:hypothetical protein